MDTIIQIHAPATPDEAAVTAEVAAADRSTVRRAVIAYKVLNVDDAPL